MYVPLIMPSDESWFREYFKNHNGLDFSQMLLDAQEYHNQMDRTESAIYEANGMAFDLRVVNSLPADLQMVMVGETNVVAATTDGNIIESSKP